MCGSTPGCNPTEAHDAHVDQHVANQHTLASTARPPSPYKPAVGTCKPTVPLATLPAVQARLLQLLAGELLVLLPVLLLRHRLLLQPGAAADDARGLQAATTVQWRLYIDKMSLRCGNRNHQGV